MKMIRLWILFLSTINLCQASPWDNLTANIAVIEYQPFVDKRLTEEQIVLENTKKYLEIIKTLVKTENFDMIIFPESTLKTSPKTSVEINIMDNPCDSLTYPEFMKNLSCAARNSNTYLVINLVEKVKCDRTNCKNSGFFFYNTDVIIDRTGKITNTYHKYNLFGEHDLDKPKVEKVVIYTDFGVKFGIFTCFDILFKSPALDLVKEDIDGVIFPSNWYSELPFLTSLQTQQMWAYNYDVLFFGAGGNYPKVGTGGSGIYNASRGTISQGYVAKGGSHIFAFRSKNGQVLVPPEPNIDILAKEMDEFYLATDSSIPSFSSTVLNVDNKTDFETHICHTNSETKSELCCNFTIQISTKQHNSIFFYTYHLVAFTGVRSFRGQYNGGTEICGIIACLNSSLSSCGLRFPKYEDIEWPVTFENIQIAAKFDKSGNRTQFPNSLLSSIRPVNASETVWIKNEVVENGQEVVERTFALKKAQNRILTFAIYGRNFEQDSPPSGGAGERAPMLGHLIVVGVFVLTVVSIRYF
nr:PREDICTED: vanin-like protein 1 [Tribolium castaneum]|eukprot:XP_008191353.1 PREDICTED: vanin-like protein 1 [Tribolium castaneum]